MIYLDHAATAALRPSALEAMLPYLTEQCGNPSALYESGRRARQAVSRARREIAETLGCLPEELYFTSGGTEADNWALLSMAEAARARGEAPFLVGTAIEHHAVLETLRYGKE
ncbi:MAG: aminotransferase class V-fold PLP-dependent enzyme, partial [Stomatobaculum longum]|nr:aminotransferase class V-fold PLP-dependent enzyme [Stomatobaculum longum]